MRVIIFFLFLILILASVPVHGLQFKFYDKNNVRRDLPNVEGYISIIGVNYDSVRFNNQGCPTDYKAHIYNITFCRAGQYNISISEFSQKPNYSLNSTSNIFIRIYGNVSTVQAFQREKILQNRINRYIRDKERLVNHANKLNQSVLTLQQRLKLEQNKITQESRKSFAGAVLGSLFAAIFSYLAVLWYKEERIFEVL